MITGVNIQLRREFLSHILDQDGDETRCDGIPLTPEILERCGFEKNKDFTYGASYTNGDIIIVENKEGYELFASEWTIGETFYYLHELQNICLDLFKFKLEIKELQNAYK